MSSHAVLIAEIADLKARLAASEADVNEWRDAEHNARDSRLRAKGLTLWHPLHSTPPQSGKEDANG